MNREKITVRLDSVRRYRNTQEYRPVNRARIGDDIEVIGDGKIIHRALEMARLAGASIEAPVVVLRGETTCFREMPLKSWFERGEQPPHLRRAAA